MAVDIGAGGGSVTDATPGDPDTLDLPADEASYHARFYFNPNSALSNNNQEITLFEGRDAGGTSIFRIEYRRRNAQGGTYQVRAVVLTAGGEQATDWVGLSGTAATAVEVAWASDAAASFSLYVDGALQQTLTGLDTSGYLVNEVTLGPSGGAGLSGASGSVYLDAFDSTRYTVIGP